MKQKSHYTGIRYALKETLTSANLYKMSRLKNLLSARKRASFYDKIVLMTYTHFSIYFFFLKPTFTDTHRLIYEKLNLFICILTPNIVFFSSNFGRMYSMKLKICMLYHMNNIFAKYISVPTG